MRETFTKTTFMGMGNTNVNLVIHNILGKEDGKIYEGEWYRNKMQGLGKTIWLDGRVYEG